MRGKRGRATAAPFLARAVTMGQNHVCAILGNGAVKCWGYNNHGQLGLGGTQSRGDQPDEIRIRR
ncbi:MAG: hypothetical protein KDB35_08435 [Acidimicrobiales bacterium]|nr:hypothetical protein [Acidimicrobiales bacterium]MCB1013983.1 hypothetical protein [Acidimicrobiales bacterium]MCB9371753.1 hypothetical protein [Microthrixaceae bacterium]